MNWVDEEGNVVSGGSLPKVSLKEGSDWFLGTDGIYYYTKPVAPNGGTTSNLLENNPIKEPTTEEGKPAGCHLEVTVLAESIQAAPSTAVTESWGVNVNSNGHLTKPTPAP